MTVCYDLIIYWSIFAREVSLLWRLSCPSWTDNNDPPMVQKFAQLTQLVHHLHKYKYEDTAALHHPSVSGQRSVVQKGQIGKLWWKILKTSSRICNTMDSANEATEQLNRAERFLTEIQDNPEVITEWNSFVVSFTFFFSLIIFPVLSCCHEGWTFLATT